MQARLVQVENGDELTSLSLADETIMIGRDPSADVLRLGDDVAWVHERAEKPAVGVALWLALL